MSKNVIFLDENEIDRRIQTAVLEAKNDKGQRVYGVSGIGQENPKLTRTFDAANVDLVLSTNDDKVECVATNEEFQKFFEFPEYTDELGNVFVTITPKAFRFDRINDGEITAISVKEYEEGDEDRGYYVHPFFKNWTSETSYNGVVSRDIAKYPAAFYNKLTNTSIVEALPENVADVEIASRSGLNIVVEEPEWSGVLKVYWNQAQSIIKQTHPRYCIASWMYVDLFRMLSLIYFGRTDILNFFGLKWSVSNNEWDNPISNITGTTNQIQSHTGFNKATNRFKIFNVDSALASMTVGGCYYKKDEGFIFSHLDDFDLENPKNGIKSTISDYANTYHGEYDIVTKFKFDEFEPAFKVGVAARQITATAPEGTVNNIYYSSVQKLNDINAQGVLTLRTFCQAKDPYWFPEDGLFRNTYNEGKGYFSQIRISKVTS